MENTMSYINNTNRTRTSLDYRFTIDSKSDPDFLKLQQLIREHNSKSWNKPLRTKLFGRGPIKTKRGCFGSHNYVKHSDATHFDVYVFPI